MRRLHNRMTNALRAICEDAGLTLEEGSEPVCLYDALIRSPTKKGCDLLVEVKTDGSPQMCRMAVGQLLDYSRLLGERDRLDLAVLFPSKPTNDARDFLASVSVKALWFGDDMTVLKGDVALTTLEGHGPQGGRRLREGARRR
jgi:hypothetical protein